MPSSAIVILVGNIGRDPELKFTSSGLAIASSSIAVKTGYGERERTTWYNLDIFGKQAERFNEWVSKGQLVQVIGTPYEDEFTGRDGQTRKTLKVNVSEFTPLERNNTQPAGNGNQQSSDGIPF